MHGASTRTEARLARPSCAAQIRMTAFDSGSWRGQHLARTYASHGAVAQANESTRRMGISFCSKDADSLRDIWIEDKGGSAAVRRGVAPDRRGRYSPSLSTRQHEITQVPKCEAATAVFPLRPGLSPAVEWD